MHVKKGDNVIVIAGKEKGKTGVISRAIPTLDKVIIEGLNTVKRHTRPKKAGEKGGIAIISQPIHVSNVKLADKGAKKEKPAAKKKTTKTAKKAE